MTGSAAEGPEESAAVAVAASVDPGSPHGRRFGRFGRFGRTVRDHQVHLARLSLLLLLLVGVILGDVLLHTRLDGTNGTLAYTQQRLAALRATQHKVAGQLAATTRLRDERRTATARIGSEIATTEQQLGTASNTSALQSLDIATLTTCLNGVTSAANSIVASDLPGAVGAINSVSASCLSIDGSASAGLVYPFDFPDPYVLTTSSGYYAFATNSAAGNIQIIQSSDHTHWQTVGDALPHLPVWAAPGATWAPSVLQRGNSYVMYYSANYATSGEQCISEAVASAPQGPYVDSSQSPVVCQLTLGGSIDPTPLVAPDGTPYLIWKSQGLNGGPGNLWSQQLTPDGTALVPGAPASLLGPDQPWQHGYIEGPSMIVSGGKYYLFYSGSDWKTATYAIGYATCDGPSGPCTDRSSVPLLGSGPAFSGPGGPSVFADPKGNLWIAFHAWLPGKVGYPFSRPLFIRPLTLDGGVPQIGP